MNKNQFLITAAVAGILGAGVFSGAPAFAADKPGSEKGLCAGTSGCKGKSACKTSDNACKGQNGCKGKGAVEMTRAKCEKMAAKAKKKDPSSTVHFEGAAPAAPAATDSKT